MSQHRPGNPPNVLWIMTDQHRADVLGCMGNSVVRTPNLDALAAGGVLFENAFCQSPVCMASRGSVFTGRYPAAIRVRGMGILPPSELTFPEMLRRAGYRTGAFGKVHFTPQQDTLQRLGSDVPTLDWRPFADPARLSPIPDGAMGENYGFEEVVGVEDSLRGLHRAWVKERAPHLEPPPVAARFDGGPRDLWVSPYPSELHHSTFIAESAQDFIRRQDGSSPWFALCSFVAPHHPFEAPADQIARYDLADIPTPPYKGGVDMRDIPPRLAAAVDEIRQYDPAMQRRILQHYYAAISLIDDNVGRLLATLRESGQASSTLIVFVADHGEFAGQHGLLRKPTFHYDETLRVPLLVAGAGLAPRRVSGLVELVDVVPTLLGLLGAPTPAGVQGVTWADALRNGSAIGRQDIYSDMFDMDPMVFGQASGPYAGCQTLRSADWKLNVYPDAGYGCSQMFHLADDPDETTNLFHDPAHRGQREAMLWRMTQRVHQQTDPLPLRLRQW